MALRAGTRTLIKSVTDRYDNLKDRINSNNLKRRYYKMKEMTALANFESAQEDCSLIESLKAASQHRLNMLQLQLQEAELDNNADKIVEATAMLESAQQEHDAFDTRYEVALHQRDNADVLLQNARDQYNTVRDEVYEFSTAQDFRTQWNEISDLRNTVSDKRRDNNLANEFNLSVNIQ